MRDGRVYFAGIMNLKPLRPLIRYLANSTYPRECSARARDARCRLRACHVQQEIDKSELAKLETLKRTRVLQENFPARNSYFILQENPAKTEMEQVEREEAKLKRLVQMQEVVPQIMKRLEQGLETKREEEQIALKLIEEVDQKLTAPGLSHEKREELDNLKTGYEMDIQDFRDSSK